jgi:hypothetical protein
MGELAKDLKTELDKIDQECIEYATDKYYNSRLKLLVGMWEKGELINGCFRGVEQPPSYREIARLTERNHPDIKKWHDLYIKYTDKEIYIKEVAEIKALEWTQKALTEGKEKNVHVSNNSGENEWYTPEYIIESAKLVMGNIDLDPASSKLANQTIKAKRYFDVDKNGLQEKWTGNIWLNPPYSQPLISQFSEKINSEINNFTQACILTNNATETEWYQNILINASVVCFFKGRIKFLDSTGNPVNTPLQGQSIVYIGKNTKEFYNEFNKYGICLKRII